MKTKVGIAERKGTQSEVEKINWEFPTRPEVQNPPSTKAIALNVKTALSERSP